MISGTYVGKVKSLKGKRALLREHNEKEFVAQFDEWDLVFRNLRMDHGWHAFPKTDFELDQVEVAP